MEQEKTPSGFLGPEEAVRSLGLELGDHVADFGAGHGYFTIPMAKIVGGDGKVYAVDIQKSVLDIIRAKAKLEHLLNIEPIWADIEKPEGSHIKKDFLDFVLISNTLFQSEHKKEVFKEAFRVLRKGGRFGLIEWDDGSSLLGPPKELRIKKEVAKDLGLDAGFESAEQFEAGNHHYGLLFIKKQ